MLVTTFEEHGWRTEKLGSTHYQYRKDSYEFEVKVDGVEIVVTIPLVGSDSRYQTKFLYYDDAVEFLKSHLENVSSYSQSERN